MRGRACLLVIVLAALLGGSSQAAEVIYFTNGTTMAIRGHETKNGMIHLDLGNDSVLAFPEYMVDRIEVAGTNVKVESDFTANQMVQGASRGTAHSQAIDPDEARKEIQERIKAYTARAREEAEERANSSGASSAAVPLASTRYVDYNMSRDTHPHPADPPPAAQGYGRAPQRKVMGGKIVLQHGSSRKPDLVTAGRAINNAPPKTAQPQPSARVESNSD